MTRAVWVANKSAEASPWNTRSTMSADADGARAEANDRTVNAANPIR